MFFPKPSKSFIVKPSHKQLLDRGKDLLLIPYAYIPSTSTVGLLLHLQHYQRCKPMVLKMSVKSKFVLCQPVYYNLLTEKRYKKIHWLCVIIMSRTIFRVNPHSIICLNVNKLLARSRRYVWSSSDTNEIQIHNHLVRKGTLNHLAKLAIWPFGQFG